LNLELYLPRAVWFYRLGRAVVIIWLLSIARRPIRVVSSCLSNLSLEICVYAAQTLRPVSAFLTLGDDFHLGEPLCGSFSVHKVGLTGQVVEKSAPSSPSLQGSGVTPLSASPSEAHPRWGRGVNASSGVVGQVTDVLFPHEIDNIFKNNKVSLRLNPSGMQSSIHCEYSTPLAVPNPSLGEMKLY